MEGNILVKTQELMNASSDFQTRNSTINDITGQMLSLVRNLASQWEGDGATSFINKFNELEDDMQRISNMIKEHVNDLQEMARIYDESEKQVQEASSGIALPTI